MQSDHRAPSLDVVMNLARRRGILFNSADIYNGAGGLWDLGPLGVEIMANLRRMWWRTFVHGRTDMLGIDAAILTPAPVLQASGHVDGFSDPLIECKESHIRLRADHYLEEDDVHIFIERWVTESAKQRGIMQGGTEPVPSKDDEAAALLAAQELYDFSDPEHPRRKAAVGFADLICPHPKVRAKTFTEPRQFNMMFATNLGPVANAGSVAYLRPETAQGIFTNFKAVVQTYNKKLPFGMAQIGKAFRNEITTGNGLFRVREFEQAEIEYFVKPGEDEAAFVQWLDLVEAFLTQVLQVNPAHYRRYEHAKEKLSHYSKRTVDFEYDFPGTGFGEVWGIANRTDFDLTQHQEGSKKDLTYFDEATRERFIPYVIEPSVGLGRLFQMLLFEHYREYPQGRDGQGSELETVLHLPACIAPVFIAVLPLMKKDGLAQKAEDVLTVIKAAVPDRVIVMEETGAIGRRYRKQDEIGTPYCVTVDYQSLEDNTVTVRDRDTMEQVRLRQDELTAYFTARA
jgi:glycyl-tRNA synthetase